MTAGRKNAEFAVSFLEEEGITILGQKLGGTDAMSVIFDTSDGKARVKVLEKISIKGTVEEESAYSAKLTQQTRSVIPDDITFFGTP